ncbi:MAG TPA: hypothetical protein VGB83_00140 [Actinomycetota bacterium]
MLGLLLVLAALVALVACDRPAPGPSRLTPPVATSQAAIDREIDAVLAVDSYVLEGSQAASARALLVVEHDQRFLVAREIRTEDGTRHLDRFWVGQVEGGWNVLEEDYGETPVCDDPRGAVITFDAPLCFIAVLPLDSVRLEVRYWRSDKVSVGPANEGVGIVFLEAGEEMLSWTAIDEDGRVLEEFSERTGFSEPER